MKKVWIISTSLIIVVILIYILFYWFYTAVKGFEVTIENLTRENVKGIFLTCAGLSKDIEVPELTQHTESILEVQPKNYGENRLRLYYKDNKGTVHEQTLIGYFEESYGNGYVTVKIENIETDGTIKIISQYRFTGLFQSSDWTEEKGR